MALSIDADILPGDLEKVPDMPDDFSPDFTTRVDPVTRNELREARWRDPQSGKEVGRGYVLAMPDDGYAGRENQAKMDEAVKEALWIGAMVNRAKDERVASAWS